MTIIIRHRKLNVPPLCNFRPETVFTRLRPRGIVETIQDINGILDSCKTQRRPEFQDRSHGMTRLGLRVEGSYPLLTKTPMASSEIPESCTGPCNPWQPPGGSLKTHLRQQMLRDRESDRMLRGGGGSIPVSADMGQMVFKPNSCMGRMWEETPTGPSNLTRFYQCCVLRGFYQGLSSEGSCSFPEAGFSLESTFNQCGAPDP